ncbi:MAG: glycosyltransferase [Chthoniobacteraceae bacterium]
MSAPLVSIAIPCYNSERWIRQCVESALNQTWPHKEVIVVDDGSTDASLAILAEFGDSIRVLVGAHAGANHARNQALQAAHGEWMQYLDSDDYLEPEKLADHLAHVGEADVIYSPVWMEDLHRKTRVPSAIDTSTDLFCQWISWQLPQTGGTLWRREKQLAIGGWNESMPCCQEHELYLRALQNGLAFTYHPTPHAVYRLWSEETLCRKDPRLVLRVRSELIARLETWMRAKSEWTEAHRLTAGQAYLEMSRTFAKYDLAEAASYHRTHREQRQIALQGPAAPLSYRMFYHLFGFTNAEKIARTLRGSAA